MKKFSVIGLIVFALLAGFMACEEGIEEEHPLVGIWDLTDMEQKVAVFADTDQLSQYGVNSGDPLGADTLTWTEFNAMGVSLSVTLKDDNSFTMTGNLPVVSDTLGFNPAIVPLNDLGTWEVADDMSTLQINGDLYQIGGTLTVDDQDDPQEISLEYSETAVADTVVLPLDTNGDGIPDTFIPNVPITENSETMLGFTKQ